MSDLYTKYGKITIKGVKRVLYAKKGTNNRYVKCKGIYKKFKGGVSDGNTYSVQHFVDDLLTKKPSELKTDRARKLLIEAKKMYGILDKAEAKYVNVRGKYEELRDTLENLEIERENMLGYGTTKNKIPFQPETLRRISAKIALAEEKLHDFQFRKYRPFKTNFDNKSNEFISKLKEYRLEVGDTIMDLDDEGEYEDYYNPLGLADLPPGGPIAVRKPKKVLKGPK